jgi:hypothetical protein
MLLVSLISLVYSANENGIPPTHTAVQNLVSTSATPPRGFLAPLNVNASANALMKRAVRGFQYVVIACVDEYAKGAKAGMLE